jgi:hypothetical protein
MQNKSASFSYVIRDPDGSQISISEARYRDIQAAHAGLVWSLSLEENFDNIRSNYFDLERLLMNFSLEHMHDRVDLRVVGDEWRMQCGRIVSNILASARAYFDQSEKVLNKIDRTGALKEKFGKARSQYYDSSPSYQLCECLRNVSQHSSSVVHGIQLNSRVVDVEDEIYFEFSVIPTLTPSLVDENKIKGRTKAMLAMMDKSVDLRPHLRHYLSGVEAVHRDLRLMISSEVSRWDSTFELALKEFPGNTLDFVETIKLSQDQEWIERVPVVAKLMLQRRMLESRNNLDYSYLTRYVTNRFVGA